jgi:hypothetical protein
MEKLYEIIGKGLCLLLLCSTLGIHAQNSLVVFKTEGRPMVKVNDSLKTLSKGSAIASNAVITIKDTENLLAIDEHGNCYKTDRIGDYTFADLLNSPVPADNSSFTKKYLTYVWNQFTNQNSAKTKTGVVFRTDNFTLLQPPDNVKFFVPEINFVWNIDAEFSYFMLKDLATGHISKFGVSGNSLTLFVDNRLLTKGNTYQWSVSDQKFPDLEQIEYFNFSIITNEEFAALKPELDSFKNDLSAIGFSTEEIKQLLCSDYKICY